MPRAKSLVVFFTSLACISAGGDTGVVEKYPRPEYLPREFRTMSRARVEALPESEVRSLLLLENHVEGGKSLTPDETLDALWSERSANFEWLAKSVRTECGAGDPSGYIAAVWRNVGSGRLKSSALGDAFNPGSDRLEFVLCFPDTPHLLSKSIQNGEGQFMDTPAVDPAAVQWVGGLAKCDGSRHILGDNPHTAYVLPAAIGIPMDLAAGFAIPMPATEIEDWDDVYTKGFMADCVIMSDSVEPRSMLVVLRYENGTTRIPRYFYYACRSETGYTGGPFRFYGEPE